MALTTSGCRSSQPCLATTHMETMTAKAATEDGKMEACSPSQEQQVQRLRRKRAVLATSAARGRSGSAVKGSLVLPVPGRTSERRGRSGRGESGRGNAAAPHAQASVFGRMAQGKAVPLGANATQLGTRSATTQNVRAEVRRGAWRLQ